MKMKNLFFIPLFLCFFLSSFAQNGDVMIQGFDWTSWSNTTGWYNVVASKATEMKNAGINTIWLPPPSDAAANEGYLPRQYYLLNSKYGTQAQLTSCISALHTNNMKVLADIVINHRVGTTGWADFTNPTWGCWAVTSDDEWKNNGGVPCGAFDTGEGYAAARDVDHTNTTVQNDITSWMNWLKTTIGFDGWRYDLVKGFNPSYVAKYNDGTQPYFSVGEFWDGNRQLVQNWVDGTAQKSTAFDFPLKYKLAEAVNGNYSVLNAGGQSSGLMGWSPCKAVTFIDNHDTYRDNNAFPADNGKVLQAYAYILTHPGIPMIFWDHYFDWAGYKTPINDLIKVRKNNNINCNSLLSIQVAATDVYAAIIDNKVAMKIGSASWSPSGTGWILKASGVNYAVWDKLDACAGFTPVLTVSPAGPYTATAPFNVTISATAPNGITPTVYYTTDGSTPTTASASANGSRVLSINATTTLKTFAVGSNGCTSAIQTHTYTINNVCTNCSFTVYFNKPASWTAPKIYYWNTVPSGAMPTVTWPGVAMQVYNGNWYKYTFTGTTSTNIIFTDGTRQTIDLTRNKTGYYDLATNTWTDGVPPVAINYVMDGNLDAVSTQIATANGITLNAHFNGTKLYVAAKSATSLGKDVFIFISKAPGTMAAAPWAKAGQVAGNNIFIANESSNNWNGWTGVTTGATSASGSYLEGTVDVATSFGSGTQTVYLSVGAYGTNDGGVLTPQLPVAVQTNGSIEANEFLPFTLTAPSLRQISGNAKKDEAITTEQIMLEQNSPNPVRQSGVTKINYAVPEDEIVSLFLTDITGRKIQYLQNGFQHKGRYIISVNAGTLKQGVYYYQLQQNSSSIIKKMVVIH